MCPTAAMGRCFRRSCKTTCSSRSIRRRWPRRTSRTAKFITALDDKTVRERLVGFGLEVTESRDNTPAHLTKHIDDFAATYGKLITEMGIKAE